MVINGINTKDISVVVQGAIDKINTQKCLENIRKFLTGAEIILSTWEGSDVSYLDYDVLILNKDPGIPYQNFIYNKILNVNSNRQLVSVQTGLDRCHRKYTIKLRTDFYIESTEFIKYFLFYPNRSNEYKFFENRVIVSSIFSRRFSSENGFPMPYHPSDIFLFGMTNDVKDFFCGTAIEPADEQYHYKFPDRKCYSNMTGKYAPEQYYCIEWIKRHGEKINFDDFTCWTMDKLIHSDKILFNNFIFLNPNQIGLRSSKHDFAMKNYINDYGIINNTIFENEYKNRYDENFIKTCTVKERYHILKIILSPLRLFVKIFLKPTIRLLCKFWKWCIN